MYVCPLTRCVFCVCVCAGECMLYIDEVSMGVGLGVGVDMGVGVDACW